MDKGRFSYRIIKDRKICIEWHGKPITVLKGPKAEKFIGDLPRRGREQAQFALAKATGKFEWANERLGS